MKHVTAIIGILMRRDKSSGLRLLETFKYPGVCHVRDVFSGLFEEKK
jgi:hypothetical protein